MRNLLGLCGVLAAAVPVVAQEPPPVTLAAEAGAALPLGEFRRNGAEVGWSVGATATLRLAGPLAVYGSAERTVFDVDAAQPAGATTWRDTGLGAGLRLLFPLERRGWMPWVQLGAGWHDTDPPPGEARFAGLDTDGILTLEGSGGLDIPLPGTRFGVRPTVRYRRYRYEITSPGETLRAGVSYLTLAVGLAWLGPEPDR